MYVQKVEKEENLRKSVVSGSFRAAGLDWSKKEHCGNTLAASCLRKKIDYDDDDDDDYDDDDDDDNENLILLLSCVEKRQKIAEPALHKVNVEVMKSKTKRT